MDRRIDLQSAPPFGPLTGQFTRRARALLVGPHATLGGAFATLSGSGSAAVVATLLTDGASAERVVSEARRLIGSGIVDVALVCLPSSQWEEAERLRRAIGADHVPCRVLPPIDDLIFGRVAAVRPTAARALPSLDLPTLVGRRSRPIDAALASRAITGRRVLITGAGGSIGSELARQAAALSPALLVLVERSENALFEIDREIAARHAGVPRRAVLHDVVDARATRRILTELRPHSVFHAAAHKHVPMMEDHPAQAVTNNLFGSRSIADAAVAAGAERFVMISTDKAVNPTSVMGATKRMAEQYVRSLAASGGRTRLCMVRFGNVLGSSGSVLQVWAHQLEEGRPLTVTDRRMTRYFMTIPEAASLVIEAGALTSEESEGADVFVLDMGEPVRIVELADRFIRAHGLDPVLPGEQAPPGPGRVPIVFTGVRPGEKLHEELAHEAERLRPTRVRGVMAWAGEAVETQSVRDMIVEMELVRSEPEQGIVLEAIRRWAPKVGGPERLSRCTEVVGTA